MNENKTYFQRVSVMLENLLKDYKNQYPKNYGDLFRDFFPILLIVLGAAAFVYGAATMTDSAMLIGVLVSPVLIVFAFSLKRVNRKNRPENVDFLSKIRSLELQMVTFNEYPDVKQYLEQFENRLNDTVKKKTDTKRLFKKLQIMLYCLVAAFLTFAIIKAASGRIKNDEDANQLYNYLELQEYKPFLTITPLTRKVTENCQIESPQIEVFLNGLNSNWLTIKELKLSGDKNGLFRLFITDNNGKHISRCPKFVFSGDQDKKIMSIMLCFDSERKTRNDFEALKVLKYLDEHKNDLRFVVEKME
ncbi:MAG: DUF308 domain-containing protein [Bacteroidales bacterium]|nr:DUF308 domain-containing protein [Bacteroidales bacterium]